MRIVPQFHQLTPTKRIFFCLKFNIMEILEKELEDSIWRVIQSGEAYKLNGHGLRVDLDCKFLRQWNFASYGICDLLSYRFKKVEENHWEIIINIYELKKDAINKDTFFQAVRYGKACDVLVENWNRNYSRRNYLSCKINLHLVGRTLEKGTSFLYLPDVFKNVFLYTYKVDLFKGILFEHQVGWYSRGEEPSMPIIFSNECFKSKL